MFDKMDDANVDHEDSYGMMTNVDAHAYSLVKCPEPHTYLTQVIVTRDVTSSQEIIEPKTYAQVVNPNN